MINNNVHKMNNSYGRIIENSEKSSKDFEII